MLGQFLDGTIVDIPGLICRQSASKRPAAATDTDEHTASVKTVKFEDRGNLHERRRETVAASLAGSGVHIERAASADKDGYQFHRSPRRFLGRYDLPHIVVWLAKWSIRLVVFLHACRTAYVIRGYSIRDYGMVIHEFDPWFNYRASEYLAHHGVQAFFKWYDYMSWYPLGRPVGTTIYPGMQFTSVGIWRCLNWLGVAISLNDVCVRVPQWFGVVATILVGALTAECSASANAGVAAAVIMSSVPAHTMRSVGGEFDNECVAISAMVLVFYLWCRAVRTPSSWPVGILAGIAYFNMAAAWGGYIFVLNMIGVHCVVLIVMGYYDASLWKAYSTFYVVGTCLAMQIPVVGHAPLRSLEQLGPCGVAVFLQAFQLSEHLCWRLKLHGRHKWLFQQRMFAACTLLLMLITAILALYGYFGPLSSRVRGLFVQHTHTGNPLVDSVAEHRPANLIAYWEYLHLAYIWAFIGLGCAMVYMPQLGGNLFLITYWLVVLFFSLKMVRLLVLAGPPASSLAGVAIGYMFDWSFNQLWWREGEEDEEAHQVDSKPVRLHFASTLDKKVMPLYYQSMYGKLRTCYALFQLLRRDIVNVHLAFHRSIESMSLRHRVMIAIFFIWLMTFSGQWSVFVRHCEWMATEFSEPSIVARGRMQNGTEVLIDDYRESYWWLRDNTAADARILAWWDYGYQITGVANRTTLADGNTWNHEHIALIGRCLTLPVREAHEIIRHLADYVLIWAGGGGDDLAKSRHVRRIASSVYRDLCPGDNKCQDWYMDSDDHPSESMGKSLLYHLHQHGLNEKIMLDAGLFREAYSSRYGKVRIYQVMAIDQASRSWNADPANRRCDAPGSWFCQGQYPPALNGLLKLRQAFQQLEDFNAAKHVDSGLHKQSLNSTDDTRSAGRFRGMNQRSSSAPVVYISGCSLAATMVWLLLQDMWQ